MLFRFRRWCTNHLLSGSLKKKKKCRHWKNKSRKNSRRRVKENRKDSRKKKRKERKEHTVTIWCVGEHRKLVFCTASCVSPQISLASARNIHPVSVRFFTPSDPLFSVPLQYLGLCSLAFRSRTFERGTRFDMYLRRHDYIHLLLYFYNGDCSVHGYTNVGKVVCGEGVASSFLFIASFRNKIASNYSVGLEFIWDVWYEHYIPWIPGPVVSWDGKIVESERSSFTSSWN